MREGLEETLTVGAPRPDRCLAATLRSANELKNLHYTRNVKRWRGGEMIQRWVSAALLDAE